MSCKSSDTNTISRAHFIETQFIECSVKFGNDFYRLDEESKAQSIKMKGISPNIDFSFVFQDLDLK